jgi:hypothetical protein
MRLAEREPTMEEIVGALRETRRGAGRMPPFTVVGGPPDGDLPSGAIAGAQNGTAGSTDIADLRDDDTERLLVENARLNARVVFLLKIIEREQARNANFAAGHTAIAADPGVNFGDLRAALEAELRPVLLVILRLLEKQPIDPTGEGARRAGHEAARPAAPVAAPHDSDGIIDLDAQRL